MLKKTIVMHFEYWFSNNCILQIRTLYECWLLRQNHRQSRWRKLTNKISRVKSMTFHNPHITAIGPPILFFLLSMKMNTFSWTQVYHVICCRLMRTFSLVNELFWHMKCRRKCCIELTHALQCAKVKQIFRYEHAILYI